MTCLLVFTYNVLPFVFLLHFLRCNVITLKDRVFLNHLLPSCRSFGIQQVVPVVVSCLALPSDNCDLTEKEELARRRPPNAALCGRSPAPARQPIRLLKTTF